MNRPDRPPLAEIARRLWLDRLAAGGDGELPVVSGSMAPLLRIGDILRIRPGDGRYRPGDLVIFSRDGKIICHRLMWWAGRGRFWQKGDLEPAWARIDRAEIVGVADAVRRDRTFVPLRGTDFRRRNLRVWFLVALRDGLQYLASRFHIRGLHAISTRITGSIARQIDRICTEKAGPA